MIISRSANDTFEVARTFAASLQEGAVLALKGDLGAGKTHFVQGLAAGLGFTGPVTSPTFTLIHEYSGGRLRLYHLDFYRLTTAAELIEIGVEEYLPGVGVTAVEWADKFAEFLPRDATEICFRTVAGNIREIDIR